MNKTFIKKIIPFLKARFAPRGARITFSQYGEDLIIKDILKKGKPKSIVYVDIGAHHPVYGNNTFLLYRDGGWGVSVEPNRELCRLIRNKRPNDICLNAGAGKSDGEANFYSFPQSTRSTFSREQAEEHQKSSAQIPETEKIKILSLDTIINKYLKDKEISVVSIDAEGLDFDILSGFSFSKRPKIFCVESATGDEKIKNLLIERGYTPVAQIFQNVVFVDEK